MKTLHTIIAAMVLAGLAGGAAGADEADQTAQAAQKDRAVYNQLVKELRGDHEQLSRAYKTAVDQARAANGEVATKLRVEILTLRERIDRNSVRMMLVASRHGWEVPEFPTDPTVAAKLPPALSPRQQLLPPDPLIDAVLASEARMLAGKIVLPVISIGTIGSRS